MLSTIPVNISVRCVCGARLSAVIVDSVEFDIEIVVDNEHKCQAAQYSVRTDGACVVHYYAGSENGYKCQLCGHEVAPRRQEGVCK